MKHLAIAASLLLLAVAPAAAEGKGLPKMADKALYCAEVYGAVASVIYKEGDHSSAGMLRGYAQNWLVYAYGFARGYYSRPEVNALRPKYKAEAKADVAAKHYRYKDCGSYENAN